MTVHPGFGGQKLVKQGVENIRLLHKRRCTEKKKTGDWDYSISVDGGVDRNTIEMVATAGADAIIAGTSIFKAPSIQEEIIFFRNIVREKLGYDR
jgi:ribulose-phosphate 3-epimerase